MKEKYDSFTNHTTREMIISIKSEGVQEAIDNMAKLDDKLQEAENTLKKSNQYLDLKRVSISGIDEILNEIFDLKSKISHEKTQIIADKEYFEEAEKANSSLPDIEGLPHTVNSIGMIASGGVQESGLGAPPTAGVGFGKKDILLDRYSDLKKRVNSVWNSPTGSSIFSTKEKHDPKKGIFGNTLKNDDDYNITYKDKDGNIINNTNDKDGSYIYKSNNNTKKKAYIIEYANKETGAIITERFYKGRWGNKGYEIVESNWNTGNMILHVVSESNILLTVLGGSGKSNRYQNDQNPKSLLINNESVFENCSFMFISSEAYEFRNPDNKTGGIVEPISANETELPNMKKAYEDSNNTDDIGYKLLCSAMGNGDNKIFNSLNDDNVVNEFSKKVEGLYNEITNGDPKRIEQMYTAIYGHSFAGNLCFPLTRKLSIPIDDLIINESLVAQDDVNLGKFEVGNIPDNLEPNTLYLQKDSNGNVCDIAGDISKTRMAANIYQVESAYDKVSNIIIIAGSNPGKPKDDTYYATMGCQEIGNLYWFLERATYCKFDSCNHTTGQGNTADLFGLYFLNKGLAKLGYVSDNNFNGWVNSEISVAEPNK